MVNNVQGQFSRNDNVQITSHQLEQLLKLLPGKHTNVGRGFDTDEELESGFSGMVSSCMLAKKSEEWIMDSGASDHMTASLAHLCNIKPASPDYTINLPTGAATVISHVGDLQLPNGLKLLNVLYVPQFQHNLMAIHKLTQDNKCEVLFHPATCTIKDARKKEIKAVGQLKNVLYYLVVAPVSVDASGSSHCFAVSDSAKTKE